MKKILGIHDAPQLHWVGDGFPVRSLLNYETPGQHTTPFLLLDYAGPARFTPADRPRGVGPHPHRGFETVTIVYQGEVAHGDSTGRGGIIGPGDVQWMTAGGGILHEEFHSEAFTRDGGEFEMVQLWVNLPARHKLAAPGYQGITRTQIPSVALPHGAGSLRVIAGEYEGHKGPARTFTAMDVWDLRLRRGAHVTLPLTEGHGAAIVVLHGEVRVNAAAAASGAHLVVLERESNKATLDVGSDATVLLLSGEPIDEPIVGHGPFVMNTVAEIEQAIADFNSGEFGQMRE